MSRAAAEIKDFEAFASIHWLGVEVVQQVVRVAVAVSAHHHQGDEGGQENGGQHPDGHDHHGLHGDSHSHSHGGGGGISDSYLRGKDSNQGRLIVPGWIMDGRSSVEDGERWLQTDCVTSNWKRAILSPHLRILLQEKSPIFIWFEAPSTSPANTISSVCVWHTYSTHTHTHHWSLSEHIRSWEVAAPCLPFTQRNENGVVVDGDLLLNWGHHSRQTGIALFLSKRPQSQQSALLFGFTLTSSYVHPCSHRHDLSPLGHFSPSVELLRWHVSRFIVSKVLL